MIIEKLYKLNIELVLNQKELIITNNLNEQFLMLNLLKKREYNSSIKIQFV